MKPSVSRMVHFYSHGQVYAAIIIHVWSDVCVNLYVLPNGFSQERQEAIVKTSVPYSMTDHDYSWHWPERI